MKVRRKIKRVLLVLLAIYVIAGVVLYFAQERILFHPKPVSKEHKFQFQQAFEEINIAFKENNVSIVRFRPGTKRNGIVLFYHGNMKNVEHYEKYPAFFLNYNYEIWMIDYPGFGKTTGKRTEATMEQQAMLMYNMVSKEISSDSIIIYGKSFGTGVASYIASNKNCKQLILETPYYSIYSLARYYFPVYPVNLMMRYWFPVHHYLEKINAPVFIFHGTKDEVIPFKHSTWLKKENKNIELISIEHGKHNDLSSFKLYQTKLDSLLQH